MSKGFELHLTLPVGALALVLGASHSGIVAAAETAMEVLRTHTDGCLLFQNIAQVLETALPKSKGHLLSVLTQLLPQVIRRPGLLTKSAVPLAYRLLDSKGELRRPAEEYVRALQDFTDLYSNVPPEKRERLETVLSEASLHH
jgi:hypothetical protein